MSAEHEDSLPYRPKPGLARRMSSILQNDTKDFATGITFGSGDFVSLFSLFFDNLSTLLGFAGAILGLIIEQEDGSNAPIVTEILYKRIVPAAGVMLFVGNIFYTWQAIRMTRKYKKAYTAQPYGLNTAGGFPFIFGIMYGVFFSYQCAAEDGSCTTEENNARFILAWQVCVAANFTTGLINIFLGFFGRHMMKFFPVAAMLVPLAGIGFTWLALNQIAPNFANPSIGLIPVFLIFTQYYALGRFHLWNGIYMPEAVPIVAFGCIAGWAYGTQDGVVAPVSGGLWAGDAFIVGFQNLGPYIGTVLPFSIAASFTDMMCLVSAQKAGDPYPIGETMIADGLGTLLGALLGSPFGTVVYIGHPVHKRVGAKTGYSMMNGFIYLILCLSGVIPTILSVIPTIAIGPIIFIFGVMICEECTKHIAERHHSAIFFGLFFGICDYIYTNWQPENQIPGQLAMSRGSALSAMIWCSIIVYTIDRRWLRAAGFCVIGAFFAGLGIIHQAEAVGSFMKGTGGNIDSTSAFEFMMGYLSMAGVCILYWVLQKYMGKTTEEGEPGYKDDHGYLPPIDEKGVDDMFETWWEPATAALEKSDETHHLRDGSAKDEESGEAAPEEAVKEVAKSVDEAA